MQQETRKCDNKLMMEYMKYCSEYKVYAYCFEFKVYGAQFKKQKKDGHHVDTKSILKSY